MGIDERYKRWVEDNYGRQSSREAKLNFIGEEIAKCYISVFDGHGHRIDSETIRYLMGIKRGLISRKINHSFQKNNGVQTIGEDSYLCEILNTLEGLDPKKALRFVERELGKNYSYLFKGKNKPISGERIEILQTMKEYLIEENPNYDSYNPE